MRSTGYKTTYEMVLKALNYDKSLGRYESTIHQEPAERDIYHNNWASGSRDQSEPVNKNETSVAGRSMHRPPVVWSAQKNVSESTWNAARVTAPEGVSGSAPNGATGNTTEKVIVSATEAAAESSFIPLLTIEKIYRSIIGEMQTGAITSA